MNTTESSTDSTLAASPWNPLHWPLYLRVILGVALGAGVGVWFRTNEIAGGWKTADFGVLAELYIRLLTALATPLIFLAIVEAFVRTEISVRQGIKMFVVCSVNLVVAFGIGLVILNVWQPGKAWQSTLAQRSGEISSEKLAAKAKEVADKAAQSSLSPLKMVRSYVPMSIAQPFTENMVLTVVVLAIFVGAAMRALKNAEDVEIIAAMTTFAQLIVACYQIILRMLGWLIDFAPYAIFFAVASVVGETGIKVFELVGGFLATVVVALALHSLVYYPLSAWLVGGKSPRVYFGEGMAAILTGFSINSSLLSAPLTLEALKRMKVSEASARLSACVGTNFNNDGITLYEAITALFIAQAAGLDLSIAGQINILLAALAGSMGIAGIPYSGIIILTLVLKAAQLPEETVQLAWPIVLSIDFINARLRSAVNVMGDLQVAILLDAGEPAPPSQIA